jgi:hypothetical protein
VESLGRLAVAHCNFSECSLKSPRRNPFYYFMPLTTLKALDKRRRA